MEDSHNLGDYKKSCSLVKKNKITILANSEEQKGNRKEEDRKLWMGRNIPNLSMAISKWL